MDRPSISHRDHENFTMLEFQNVRWCDREFLVHLFGLRLRVAGFAQDYRNGRALSVPDRTFRAIMWEKLTLISH